jgi:hypothetical protein
MNADKTTLLRNELGGFVFSDCGHGACFSVILKSSVLWLSSLKSNAAQGMEPKIPEYEDPPVVEVALSWQFEPIELFRSVHFGLLWERLREEGFSQVEDHGPLSRFLRTLRSILHVLRLGFTRLTMASVRAGMLCFPIFAMRPAIGRVRCSPMWTNCSW